MPPINILGISGSLRRHSFNTALLRAAQAGLDSEDINLDIVTLHGIPLYDSDLESESGEPQAVSELKKKILACDALLLSTPEYNNGIPGVFKNAIDWLSRPSAVAKNIFADRPVAVMGASPGGFGTLLSQTAWLPVLKTLGARHWAGGRLMASRASQLFSESGELTDAAMRKQLHAFLLAFANSLRGTS